MHAARSFLVANTLLNSTQELHKQHNIPYAEGTFWHANQFAHLVTYGGTYYSYLWCQKMSEVIYDEKFNIWDRGEDADELARRAGGEYWEDVLRHGGSKDP